MIRKELVKNNECIKHCSDAGMMIRQVETGILYEDAVDTMPCKYTYEETDTPIPEVEREVEEL